MFLAAMSLSLLLMPADCPRPPAKRRAVGQRTPAPPATGTASPIPICPATSTGWKVLEPDDSWFRIWLHEKTAAADRANGRALRAALEEAWPKVKDYMGQVEPLSDDWVGCGEWATPRAEGVVRPHGNGGDGRLDVYAGRSALPGATSWYPLRGCQHVPAYIDFPMPFSDVRATAAHELTHTVQLAHKWPVIGGCAGGVPLPPIVWWAEATAACAENVVHPATRNNEGMLQSYLADTSRPLDQNNDRRDGYQVAVFPLFLYHTVDPLVVSRIWKKLETAPSVVDGIETTIPGGFKKQWPEFAKQLTNEGPWQLFCRKNQFGVQPTMKEIDLRLGRDEPHKVVDLDASFGRLSIRYYHVKIGGKARSVEFLNPFAGGGFDHIAINALVKVDGRWQEDEPWTGKEKISFCRDKRGESVEEIILVVSNSTWKPGAPDASAPRPPRLIATNIGCKTWKGSATYRFDRSGIGTNDRPFRNWITATTEVTFERTEEPCGFEGCEVYRPVGGNVTWTCGGETSRGCTGEAAGSRPPATPYSGIVILSRTPGEEHYREYLGSGVFTTFVSVCGESGDCPIDWWETQEPNSEVVWRVHPDGVMDEDSTYDNPLGDETRITTRHWHFEPVSDEPLIAARPPAGAVAAAPK